MCHLKNHLISYTFSYICLAFLCTSSANANEKDKDTLPSFDHVSYDFCGQLGWLDDAYCYLNYGVDSAANSINDWFKHEGGNNESPATTRNKLRFGWEPRSGDYSEFDFRFKIRIKLPALEDRVELFFSDEEDEINDHAVKAARTDQLGNRERSVLALQFKKDEDDKMSYRVGFGRGSQLYTRARYSDKLPFSDRATLFYHAETNYYSSDRFGVEMNAEFKYVLSSLSAFQINNSFRFRDNNDDWLWRHEFQYFRTVKKDTSYLFTATIDGLSQPNYSKRQMFVSLRYKRKVLRDWLFIEVEPFVLWLREENFRASVGLSLRTEIIFST